MPGKTTISFRLPDHALAWVRAQARLRRVSVTYFIRELIMQEMNSIGDEIPPEENPAAYAESRVMVLHSRGTSMAGIARALNAEGVFTARGGSWYASTVSNILKRAMHRK